MSSCVEFCSVIVSFYIFCLCAVLFVCCFSLIVLVVFPCLLSMWLSIVWCCIGLVCVVAFLLFLSVWMSLFVHCVVFVARFAVVSSYCSCPCLLSECVCPFLCIVCFVSFVLCPLLFCCSLLSEYVHVFVFESRVMVFCLVAASLYCFCACLLFSECVRVYVFGYCVVCFVSLLFLLFRLCFVVC